jgi:hypothetical protein
MALSLIGYKDNGCRTRSLGVCDHELVLYGEKEKEKNFE